jgi:glycosyltransferase involved in cell wall biosynthesis
MLRIGIDGRPFLGKRAGTGRYVAELCLILDRLLPEARFFVYSNSPIAMPVTNDRWVQVDEPTALFKRLPNAVWYLHRCATLIKRDEIDVFWGAANFLPCRLDGRTRTILTVLDLVPALFPQTIGLKHRLAYQMHFAPSVRKADRLVTISHGTKTRLLEMFGCCADAVVTPCVNNQFSRPDSRVIDAVKAKYGLRTPFLLTVATLQPRKNLTALLQAMMSLKDKGLDLPSIALVGQAGWRNAALLRVIENAKSAGIDVIRTGFVPDADLPALYAASKAFVFPSIYEGFGMPVVEALRCGAVVLASDTPEIREAGGDQAIYFEPTVTGISIALEAFLRESQSDQGRCKIKLHNSYHSTWEAEGQKLADLISALK